MMHEFDSLIWPSLTEDVKKRIIALRKTTSGVFHDSTLYFALCKGLDGDVNGKAFTAISRNQCAITYDTDEVEGVLQDQYVGEGVSTQLIEGIDTGYEYDEWLPGDKITLWVISWKEFSPNHGAFRLIKKAVKYGNCFHCYMALPIGMRCKNCRFGIGAVSLTLYFVHSESALQCNTRQNPPSWFTDRHKPCHPFELSTKLTDLGTKPLFDELYFEETYGPAPKYSPNRVHWKPIALQKLVDDIFRLGWYMNMNSQHDFEDHIRRVTNADLLDIFDCVNKNRDKFQPEEWDRLLYKRTLQGYSVPSHLFHHRTQEEIEMDEEAD